MALIAREWHRPTGGPPASAATTCTTLDISTRDFVCQACSNECDIKEFTIEGQKSYWGDKCSDRFRKPVATGRQPVIDDLFEYRDRLLEEIAGRRALRRAAGARHDPVGIPRTMSTLRPLPVLARVLLGARHRACCRGRPTGRSPRDGDRTGARPALLPGAGGARTRAVAVRAGRGLRPGARTSSTAESHEDSAERRALLPVEPDAALRAAVGAAARGARRTNSWRRRLHFQLGPRAGQEGAGRDACAAGRAPARERPRRRRGLRRAARLPGAAARGGPARRSRRSSEPASPASCWSAARYNIYDRSINCDIPRKLRHHYGANVIPLDFLVTGREAVDDLHANMYWTSGQRILEAARLVALAAEPAHDLHLQLQVRAGLLHQVLHARGRRRAAAGAAVRRPRQRRRLPDALRSVPGQQGNSAMLLRIGRETTATPARRRPPADGQEESTSRRWRTAARGAFAAALPLARRGRRRSRRPPTTARANWARATPRATSATRPRSRSATSCGCSNSPDVDPARTVFFMPTADGPCRFGQYAALPAPRARRPRLSARSRCSRRPAAMPTAASGRWPARSSAPPGARWWPPTSCRSSCCSTARTSAGMGAADAVFEECLNEVCCATLERAARRAGRQLRRPARRAGPMSRALHRPRHAARSGAARSSAWSARSSAASTRSRTRTRCGASSRPAPRCGCPASPSGSGTPVSEQYRKLRLHGQIVSMRSRLDLDPGEGAAPRRAGAARTVPQRLRGIRGARRGRGGRGGAPLPAAGRRARRDGAERREGDPAGRRRASTASSTSARSPA